MPVLTKVKYYIVHTSIGINGIEIFPVGSFLNDLEQPTIIQGYFDNILLCDGGYLHPKYEELKIILKDDFLPDFADIKTHTLPSIKDQEKDYLRHKQQERLYDKYVKNLSPQFSSFS